jgi:hypothetical protein
MLGHVLADDYRVLILSRPDDRHGQPGGAGMPGRQLHLGREDELRDQAVATSRPAEIDHGVAADRGSRQRRQPARPSADAKMSTRTQARDVVCVRACSGAAYPDAVPKPDDAPSRPPLPADHAAALDRAAAVGVRGRPAACAPGRLPVGADGTIPDREPGRPDPGHAVRVRGRPDRGVVVSRRADRANRRIPRRARPGAAVRGRRAPNRFGRARQELDAAAARVGPRGGRRPGRAAGRRCPVAGTARVAASPVPGLRQRVVALRVPAGRPVAAPAAPGGAVTPGPRAILEDAE